MSEASQTAKKDTAYRVLARAYRPSSFEDAFIGQDAMVRTLTNAFESGRLAHAFVLTGVRGVGKTTTARIIARALNCVGPDGTGGPTIRPCGVCEFCKAISEDRLPDVIEMDAASRTGVDDIRELIDGVRYRPVSARYKVYIIDEVHMLSKNAFNALLKTLEEPPAHVKFVFATTEIRKVPVTVLSRCQRFDLRRVDADTLARHFAAVAEKEGAKVDEAAIRLIARAADGSVRDGMSLLDQAIAVSAGAGEPLGEDAVRKMLGLADRARSFEVFEKVMAGDAAAAVSFLAEDYAAGGDPLTQLQDLLDVIHWVTRLKVAPAAADDPMVAEIDRVRGKEFAAKLSMAELTRAWQMVLKGVREAQSAPAPLQAAEMILIRLAYLTDLPAPADALKELSGAGASAPRPAAPAPSRPAPRPSTSSSSTQAVARAEPRAQIEDQAGPRSFNDIVALCEAHNERMLKAELVKSVRLVAFQPGHLEIRIEPGAAKDLPNRLSKFLAGATGSRWMITLAEQGGAETLGEQREAADKARREEIQRSAIMRSILDSFPGAELEQVRQIGQASAIAGAAAAAAMMPTNFDGDVPPPSGEGDYGDVDPDGDLDL